MIGGASCALSSYARCLLFLTICLRGPTSLSFFMLAGCLDHLGSAAPDSSLASLQLVRDLPPPPSPPLVWSLGTFTYLLSLLSLMYSMFHREAYLKKFMDSLQWLDSGEKPKKTGDQLSGSRIDLSKSVEEIMTDIPPREEA